MYQLRYFKKTDFACHIATSNDEYQLLKWADTETEHGTVERWALYGKSGYDGCFSLVTHSGIN